MSAGPNDISEGRSEDPVLIPKLMGALLFVPPCPIEGLLNLLLKSRRSPFISELSRRDEAWYESRVTVCWGESSRIVAEISWRSLRRLRM